jgi:hypothetical protein
LGPSGIVTGDRPRVWDGTEGGADVGACMGSLSVRSGASSLGRREGGGGGRGRAFAGCDGLAAGGQRALREERRGARHGKEENANLNGENTTLSNENVEIPALGNLSWLCDWRDRGLVNENAHIPAARSHAVKIPVLESETRVRCGRAGGPGG